MRNSGLAAAAVLIASIAARLSVSSFSLYLEPYDVVHRWHAWQLVTWIPAGATLTFIVHALLVGFAISRGAKVTEWLGLTFAAGALTTLLAYGVPALFSCTFTGAGVGACAALVSWSSTLTGPKRAAASALALVPAVLDATVDGLYMLVPFGFALLSAGVWVRWRRRLQRK